MKALIADHPGSPEVLKFTDAPLPQFEDDELLLRVEAIGINPVDNFTRQHTYFGVFPKILGVDFAGVVEQVGKDSQGFKVGDRVTGLKPSPREAGTYAEFVTTKDIHAAIIPDSISFEQAAALPVASLTALQVLYYDMSLKRGQRVLIHGGAGGVGAFAIQLAKLRGAYVYATSSPQNFDFLEMLGADEVIDYREKDFRRAQGVDAVLDPFSGETQELSLPLLAEGGLLVSVLPYPIRSERVAKGQIRAFTRNVHASGGDLERVLRLVASDQLQVMIQHTLPFSDIVLAHHLVATGHMRGKLVLNKIH